MIFDQKQEFEIKSQSFRFRFLILFTAVLFSILSSRLFFLQIYHGEKLNHYSDNNRFKKQLVLPPRGLILDRKNRLLASNKKVVQLILHVSKNKNPTHILQKISKIIQLPIKGLEKKIQRSIDRNGLFQTVVLKENLSLMEIHKLKQLQWDHLEIQVRKINKRVYPLKEIGSQIIGFIGSLSKKDISNLRKRKKLFHSKEIVGKSGFEKIYNQTLKGKNGFSIVQVNAQNRIAHIDSNPFNFLKIKPEKGKNLILTLDKNLQSFVSKAMKRKDLIGFREGSVIVMKTNGEILAMLSNPSFDPNLLTSSLDQMVWKQLSAKGSKVFINKSLQELYSPGSIFKPFVALAALEEGIITKDTIIDSPGVFKIGKRIYHDHTPKGHGKINVIKALEKSANVFFYQMGDRLGIETIYYYAELFGFGQKTEINLEGENQGLLPHPSWKEKTFKKKWLKGDTINVAIGQGDLLTTLLQMTVAYNAIATEGLIVKPFIVKQKPNGEIVQSVVLDSLTDRIQRDHFLTIKQGLYQVVQGSQGTARYYKLPQISFSGKTGTAQIISLKPNQLYKSCYQLPKKYRHHGWFVSFAPSEQPEIIVSVVTENSCSGSRGSAPIARDIIDYYTKEIGFKK